MFKFRFSTKCKAIGSITHGNNYVFILSDTLNVCSVSINQVFIVLLAINNRCSIHQMHNTVWDIAAIIISIPNIKQVYHILFYRCQNRSFLVKAPACCLLFIRSLILKEYMLMIIVYQFHIFILAFYFMEKERHQNKFMIVIL